MQLLQMYLRVEYRWVERPPYVPRYDMRTKNSRPAITSTINANPTQLKSAPEHERRVADVDIDQTITASQAEARFSMDAQRRKIASRIIIEAVSTGALEMMCKTIVTESPTEN